MNSCATDFCGDVTNLQATFPFFFEIGRSEVVLFVWLKSTITFFPFLFCDTSIVTAKLKHLSY